MFEWGNKKQGLDLDSGHDRDSSQWRFQIVRLYFVDLISSFILPDFSTIAFKSQFWIDVEQTVHAQSTIKQKRLWEKGLEACSAPRPVQVVC